MAKKKIRTIEAFIDGKCFARAKTKNGVALLMEQIEIEDCEAVNKIADNYMNDIETNALSGTYYLAYNKRQHALKAMDEEFFEKMYNSGIKSPYIFEV